MSLWSLLLYPVLLIIYRYISDICYKYLFTVLLCITLDLWKFNLTIICCNYSDIYINCYPFIDLLFVYLLFYVRYLYIFLLTSNLRMFGYISVNYVHVSNNNKYV